MRQRTGRRRAKLFSRPARRPSPFPLSLAILAALIALFALVTPSQFPLSINPGNVKVPAFTPTPTALPRPTDVHGGHIVFTCTRKEVNQICMINADGTGYQQLTDGDANSYYPAISPDGQKVVFSQNQYDYFDLYMFALRVLVAPGAPAPKLARLTDYIGNAYSPTFSPDGSEIIFVNRVSDGLSAVWIMKSAGSDPHPFYSPPWDVVGAAWSPDGKTVALTMASDSRYTFQVFLLDFEHPTLPPRQISHGLDGIGGSVAWSPDQKNLLIFAGPVAAREIYRLDVHSGAASQLTFGGNNASASYSPDGQYIVFNSLRNNGQADLYVMRADGHSMRRLTDNPEPDWQPQWGP